MKKIIFLLIIILLGCSNAKNINQIIKGEKESIYIRLRDIGKILYIMPIQMDESEYFTFIITDSASFSINGKHEIKKGTQCYVYFENLGSEKKVMLKLEGKEESYEIRKY